MTQYPRKLHSICTSMDSSVDPSGSPSITSSPSAETLLKVPGNIGEKHAVNYLHEITVKSPSVCTLYSTSVIGPSPCIICTICLYIIWYICHCTHPCIICTICPCIMHYIVHLTCLYIMCYICHYTCQCIHHPFHPFIHQTTNVRNSWKNSTILIMGRKTHLKVT